MANFQSFGMGYQQFADDSQLFVAVDTANSAILTRVTDCSDAVRRSFLENDLLLNGNKSETVVIGAGAQLKSAIAALMSVNIRWIVAGRLARCHPPVMGTNFLFLVNIKLFPTRNSS